MKKASLHDVQQLVSLMTEFYAESPFTLNQGRAAKAFTGLLSDDRFGHVWFIQADSRDVGYIVVTFCYSMEYGGPSAFVDDLFVQKPFRGRGLAGTALAEVRVFCVERGIRSINVEAGRDNAPAQAVYRKAGFTDTDRQLLTLKLAEPSHAKD